MFNKASLVSLAVLAAACSGGGSSNGGDLNETPPPSAVPPTSGGNTAPTVTTTEIRAQVGEALTVTIATTDAEGDPVTLTLVDGPDWISLTSDGQLTGTPVPEDIGTFDIIIDASDGNDTTTTTIAVTLFMDPVEQALLTGDFTFIEEKSDTDVESVLLDFIDSSTAAYKNDLEQIYQLEPGGEVTDESLTPGWNPDGGFASFAPTFGVNAPLATSLFRYTLVDQLVQYPVWVIGRTEENQRYIVIGANPFALDYDAEQEFHQLIKNTLEWLHGTAIDGNVHIAISDGPGSGTDRSVRAWLDAAWGGAVTYTNYFECSGEDFQNCITDETDLVLLFDHDVDEDQSKAFQTRLAEARADGIPLLYVTQSTSSPLATEMLSWLRIGAGPTDQHVLAHMRSGANNSVRLTYDWFPHNISTVRDLVYDIKNDNIDLDFGACTDSVSCEQDETVKTKIAQLRNALTGLQRDIVRSGEDPFKTEHVDRFFRALLLTGDFYRDLTTYPMPKDSTPSSVILRALFGELALVLRRESTPAPSSIGTYSRADFDDSLLVDETVLITSLTPFTTTGVYALPGQAVTVTRTDSSDIVTSLQVQSLSANSSAPFRTVNGTNFDRPVFVTSTPVTIAPGETVTFNSPYGGPIHLYASDAGSEVSLEFSNVGNHPVWRSTAESEQFLIDLAADNYDWVEIISPTLELHTTREKMQEALSQPRYQNDVQNYVADAEAYFHNWPQWFEGLQGGTIEDNPILKAHAITTKSAPAQLSHHQHMNADRSVCEEGCLGNPWEVSWAFDPLSRQDQKLKSRQMEGLSKANRKWEDYAVNRGFSFTGGDASFIHDMSYIHTHYRYYRANGVLAAECPTLPHFELYALLQDAHRSGMPESFIQNENVRSADMQSALYFQIMAALQAQGVFEDGWQLWPMFNHYQRRWARGDLLWGGHAFDDGKYLGYGDRSVRDTYLRAKAMDWQLVALSWISQRDFTAYLENWGLEFSDQGKSIVASYGYEPLQPAFYAIPETGHCTSLDYPELPVDGTSTWR